MLKNKICNCNVNLQGDAQLRFGCRGKRGWMLSGSSHGAAWARGWEMLDGAGSELVFPRKVAWSRLWGGEAATAVGQGAAPCAELGKALGGWWGGRGAALLCHQCTLNLAIAFCRVNHFAVARGCSLPFWWEIFVLRLFPPALKGSWAAPQPAQPWQSLAPGSPLCPSPWPGTSKDKALAKSVGGFFDIPFSTGGRAVFTHWKSRSTHSPGATARLCWPLGHRMVAVAPPSVPSPCISPGDK